MWWWRSDRGPLTLGFTAGGGSGESGFGTNNLALHVGDDQGAVLGRRRRLADDLGIDHDRLITLDQVHGAEVIHTDQAPPEGVTAGTADAGVCGSTGVALMVLVADCTPVLLWDLRAGLVAVAHAGRQGLVAGVVPNVVAAMRARGADALAAVIGPSICGRCYEVPDRLRDEVAAVAPESRSVTWRGTPGLDIAAGVAGQLVSHGVDIEWIAGCTYESPELYSYRRQPRTGRAAGVILRR